MAFITVDRSQANLFGYCIEDFAKSDAKSRFVVDIVSRLKLDSLFTRYSDQGGDSYAPDMMLALWFYAYSNGITSTRKLEELYRYDTRYIYMSANLKPDHTTLSRFRQAHLDLISEYFVQIVLFAQESGITDLNHIAIDGTKIKASANAKHSYKEDQLKQKIEAIRRDINLYMNVCDNVERGINEIYDLASIHEEKKRLEFLEKELIERQKQLQDRKSNLKPEHRNNHSINLVDPDARFMNKTDGPGYNAQIAVDDSHCFILANDVTDDPNDKNQFSSMHQKTEEHLPENSARQYTTDSGYHSLEQLEYIENNAIDAVIADPTPENRSLSSKPASIEKLIKENTKLNRKDSIYHLEDDYYECPAGQKLTRLRKKKNITIYQSNNCGSCPLIHLCLKKTNNNRQIVRDDRENIAEKMAVKLKTESAKIRMKIRAISAEPVFGNLKHNLGFRSFSLRGLGKVKAEFNLMCIAHNLNILFSLMQFNRLTTAIAESNVVISQHITISKIILAIFIHIAGKFKMSTSRLKYGFI